MVQMSALLTILCYCAAEVSSIQNADPVKLGEDVENWYLSNGLVELTIHKELARLVHHPLPGDQRDSPHTA